MIKVDLVTGFLGAGKTTFIKEYIKYLKTRGERIHIIENEFAEQGIDSDFLHEDEDECCSISDLSGMCMCCIGKKEFIRLLLESSQGDCDRIVVEPSGIYDVDEFFDVLSDARVCQYCEIGSIITILDPMALDGLSQEVRYLMFAQLLASGTVLFSKTQMLSPADIDAANVKLEGLLAENGCDSGLMGEVCYKPWSELTASDFEEFEDSAYFRLVHDRELFDHSGVFQSEECKLLGCADEKALKEKVQGLFDNRELGQIYRVKGFAKTLDGGCYQVNCTGQLISIEECELSTEKISIIGQKLRIGTLLKTIQGL